MELIRLDKDSDDNDVLKERKYIFIKIVFKNIFFVLKSFSVSF